MIGSKMAQTGGRSAVGRDRWARRCATDGPAVRPYPPSSPGTGVSTSTENPECDFLRHALKGAMQRCGGKKHVLSDLLAAQDGAGRLADYDRAKNKVRGFDRARSVFVAKQGF